MTAKGYERLIDDERRTGASGLLASLNMLVMTSGGFDYSGADCIDARYGATHKLGLALRMGFLRLRGRFLNAVRVVPASLWTHLGKQLGVPAPELASLKAMYGRVELFLTTSGSPRKHWAFAV